MKPKLLKLKIKDRQKVEEKKGQFLNVKRLKLEKKAKKGGEAEVLVSYMYGNENEGK